MHYYNEGYDSDGQCAENRTVPEELPRVESLRPKSAFKTVEEFTLAHRMGAEAEFAFETWQISKFNQTRQQFKAWPITAKIGEAPTIWMLFVAPAPNDAMLPKEDETCKAMVFTDFDCSNYQASISRSSASRVENPCAAWGIKDQFWQSCMAFEISLYCNDSTAPPPDEKLASNASKSSEMSIKNIRKPAKPTTTLTPALSTTILEKNMGIDAGPLDARSCIWVVFELRLSSSTRDAEIKALDALTGARDAQATRRKEEPNKNIGKSLEAQLAAVMLGSTENPIFAVDPPLDFPASSLPEAPAADAATMEKRVAAFEYFVLLKHKQTSSLFDVFPHMRSGSGPLPLKLNERLNTFNAQQREAYIKLLGNIKDGICMVPGGPGAGKTFWNLTVAAALQSKDEIKKPGHDSPSKSHNSVLYLLDMNRPLTDVANKMVQVYKDLGLTKHCCDDCGAIRPRSVIRMFCWSYEKDEPTRGYITTQRKELDNRRARLRKNLPPIDKDNGPLAKYAGKAAMEDSTEKVELQGFAAAFFRKSDDKSKHPRPQRPTGQDCFAKTLDEAAAEFYEQHRNTKYADVRLLLNEQDKVPSLDLMALRNALVERVYRDTLNNADFIATTPVTASKFANALFNPSIVIFDEAPHARDLSLLISIASFSPHAWLLTGDHRQTRPFVKSEGYNKYFEQLRLSVMERAYIKDPAMLAMLINHRANGNLQELASQLFYDSKMVAAVDSNKKDAIPKEVLYLRENYIKRMKVVKGPGKMVSRLLVVLKDCGFAKQMQSSWFHEGHQEWVMNLIDELTKDRGFKQVNSEEKGTILVMSPYKRAFTEYGRAIKQMKKRDGLGGCIVETRTVDTSQGHEADVCIIDYVHDKCTKHLEDANRMNVAITRARQMEIIVMTRGMIASVENARWRFPKLAEMIAYCKQTGQYVYDPRAI